MFEVLVSSNVIMLYINLFWLFFPNLSVDDVHLHAGCVLEHARITKIDVSYFFSEDFMEPIMYSDLYVISTYRKKYIYGIFWGAWRGPMFVVLVSSNMIILYDIV